MDKWWPSTESRISTKSWYLLSMVEPTGESSPTATRKIEKRWRTELYHVTLEKGYEVEAGKRPMTETTGKEWLSRVSKFRTVPNKSFEDIFQPFYCINNEYHHVFSTDSIQIQTLYLVINIQTIRQKFKSR